MDQAVPDELDLLGDHEENLAERLSKLVIDNELEDPAIMQAVQTRPLAQVCVAGWNGGQIIVARREIILGGLHMWWKVLFPVFHQLCPSLQQPGSLNSSIWDGPSVLRRIRGPLLTQVQFSIYISLVPSKRMFFSRPHYFQNFNVDIAILA